jgi:hypothetical protein
MIEGKVSHSVANFLHWRKLGMDLELPFFKGNIVNVVVMKHQEDSGCFHNQWRLLNRVYEESHRLVVQMWNKSSWLSIIYFSSSHLQKIILESKKEKLHSPGIEPGTSAWKADILPLN